MSDRKPTKAELEAQLALAHAALLAANGSATSTAPTRVTVVIYA